MTETRYAVIGAGWISQIAFLPAVHQTGNSRVTALVTGNPERARELADFHGIPDVISYDELDGYLASGHVDAVYIATPNSSHADFAIRAARAGCHALVEKPLAITVDECDAMIAAHAEAGTYLMTAYRLHHDPGTIDMLDRIRGGEIGEPRLFSSVFGFQIDAGNHRLKGGHWGGPLQDLGVYCLNAARHVFQSEPVEVTAMFGHGDNDPRFAETHETVAVTLRFPGDRLAQFMASFGTDARDMMQVLGTKGTLTADPGYKFEHELHLTRHADEEVLEQVRTAENDDFGAMIAYFSDCIQTGTPPQNDGAEGRADVVIMRAIEEAAQTGQPQRIDLPPRPGHPDATTLRRVPRTDRRLVF